MTFVNVYRNGEIRRVIRFLYSGNSSLTTAPDASLTRKFQMAAFG